MERNTAWNFQLCWNANPKFKSEILICMRLGLASSVKRNYIN